MHYAPHPVSLESHVSLESWETIFTLKYNQKNIFSIWKYSI